MAFGTLKALMQRRESAQMDMTHGPLLSKILVFALPLALSSMLQQLFNSVDIAVVGRFASKEALAAVGSNTSVISLLINLFVGLSVGANVVIANYIGRKKMDAVRRSVNTVGLLAIISGVLLLVTGLLAARPILEAMGTPKEVLPQAVLYLRLFFCGMPFMMIYNFGASILRSIGDTRRPLYILVVAGVVNTLLNLYFVISLKWGVAGVAISTTIANGVAAWLMVEVLRREVDPLRLRPKRLALSRHELGKILRIGLPASLQGVVFSFANVFLQTTINTFGADAIAGSAASQNFEYYCYFLLTAFTGAAVTFIGQNYGAGCMKRCRRVFWLCMALAVVVTASSNLFFTWQSGPFLSIFTDDAQVIRFGQQRMALALALQFLACSYEVSGAALRGIGYSLLPALLTVFGSCVLRLAWIYFAFPLRPTFSFLLTAYPVSWVLTGIMVLTAWFVISHRKLRQREREI